MGSKRGESHSWIAFTCAPRADQVLSPGAQSVVWARTQQFPYTYELKCLLRFCWFKVHSRSLRDLESKSCDKHKEFSIIWLPLLNRRHLHYHIIVDLKPLLVTKLWSQLLLEAAIELSALQLLILFGKSIAISHLGKGRTVRRRYCDIM